MLDPPRPMPEWTVQWLSQARLAPYLAVAGPARALELYRWNCRISVGLFELIGWFEVAWRNIVDAAISSRRDPDEPHWLLDTGFPLQPTTRSRITKAITAVQRGGVPTPSPGQIIAELPLGFWRFPTMRGYNTTVWAPYLSRAFPHAPARPQRREVDRLLQPIILLRNRIAHHEPIFASTSALLERVADILELGRWMNPDAADWWARHTSIERMLDRPRAPGLPNAT